MRGGDRGRGVREDPRPPATGRDGDRGRGVREDPRPPATGRDEDRGRGVREDPRPPGTGRGGDRGRGVREDPASTWNRGGAGTAAGASGEARGCQPAPEGSPRELYLVMVLIFQPSVVFCKQDASTHGMCTNEFNFYLHFLKRFLYMLIFTFMASRCAKTLHIWKAFDVFRTAKVMHHLAEVRPWIGSVIKLRHDPSNFI